MSAPAVFPGQLIAGKYRVERVLGEGGHGVVVAAEHLALGERVAIKLLHPDYAADREVVARFLREARAAVRIKGEHVTRVLDVGSTEGGVPFMVMEHLQGHDLGQVLDARTRLSITSAVDYVLQTCEALAEAHGIGVVHRDIKPANLFLTRRADGTPFIKVLDFGISKALPNAGAVNPSFTQTQDVVGSPQYMAPEQMQNPKLIDQRTDVWGLGATLYELLAGEPPFNAATLPEIFAKILRDPAPPIQRPDLPPALMQIVWRCLDKNLNQRFPNVAELARALSPFAQTSSENVADRINRVGVLAYQSGSRLPAASVHDIDQAFAPQASQASQAKKNSPLFLALGLFGAVVAVAIGVGVIVVVRGKPIEPAPVIVQSAAPVATTEPTLPPAPATGVEPEPAPAISESVAAPHAPAPRPTVHVTTVRPSASVAPTRPPGTASSRYD
jgi:serine/threonine-protein kinase